MTRHRPRSAKLQVEPLESRVMLAVGDSPANLGLDTNWQTAIQGENVSVELAAYSQLDNYFLKITGNGHGQLSVDLSQLPASVVNLQISSFDSVILTGEHTVDNLVLRDIGRVDAGQITINSSLAGYNVEHVKIDEAPKEIVFRPEMLGELGGKTLLEAERIAPGGFILSFLDNLGVKSVAPIQQLSIVSGNTEQNIFLSSQPSGLVTNARISIVSGDFDRYFFSTPPEQAALEKTPLVTRVLAVADYVSFASLLSNPALRATLGETLEANTSRTHVRPLTESALEASRLELGAATSLRPELLMNPSDSASNVAPVEQSNAWLEAPVGGVAVMPVEHTEAHVTSPAFAADGDIRLTPVSTLPSTGTGLTILSLALARLSEPFVQTVLNLQTNSASFGEIVTAQVSSQLQADNRPALLVDTRGTKSREEQDLVVVNV